MANHVRIDRVTQGPDGQETPAARLSVDSEDFLWIYVEAKLPSGVAHKGQYFRLIGGEPDARTPVLLDPPETVSGQYRFSVIHYVLAGQSKFLFHFADDLSAPK